jgi:hypothetical protein
MSTLSNFLPYISANSSQSVTSYSSSSSIISSASDRRGRQLNYKKTQINSVQHIECRCLYRVLMKIEIPFRGVQKKNLRHRFIKLLYETARSREPNYTAIIAYIQQHLGLYISLMDTRQLVLYSALFGTTDHSNDPTNEEIVRVIKRCPLTVPPFVNFKRWSKDVKRLENNLQAGDITKVTRTATFLYQLLITSLRQA